MSSDRHSAHSLEIFPLFFLIYIEGHEITFTVFTTVVMPPFEDCYAAVGPSIFRSFALILHTKIKFGIQIHHKNI
jgi:hypothetical protein